MNLLEVSNNKLEEYQTIIDELKNENNELLTELIETKLKAATYATETDEERKKTFSLKKKLQLYAERVATLEVTVAERLTSENTTTSNHGGDQKNSSSKSRWGRKK